MLEHTEDAALSAPNIREQARPAAQGDPVLGPGRMIVAGQPYLLDAKGALVPLRLVKAQHLLEDETVRKVVGYAEDLSAQIARFREHTFDDVDGLLAVLTQEYGGAPGGRKGNITLTTYDGLLKVQVAVADHVSFGPELQVAKGLVDECLREWSEGGRAELKAVVEGAFQVDKEGQVDRTQLLGLLRLDITDERWSRAMRAIRESMRVIGSKRYVRIYRRAAADAKWEHVSIDVASA